MEPVYADMTEYEKEVAAYPEGLGLDYTFESPIFVYDEKGRPRVWAPDFYIPKLGMHIEVWGSSRTPLQLQRKNIQNERIPRNLRPRLQTPQRLEESSLTTNSWKAIQRRMQRTP